MNANAPRSSEQARKRSRDATERERRALSPHATAVEEFEEIAPVVGAPAVYGPPVLLLLGPWLLLVLLIIPPAALLFTVLVVLAAPLVAAALVVAVVASPYLLVRTLRRRRAGRRESSEDSVPIVRRVPQADWATERAGGTLPLTHVPWVGD